MAKKKLTVKQVATLAKTMRTAMRILLNDKLDYGSDSNVKMSVQAIVEMQKFRL